jgi:hypothetical protein
MVSTADPYGRNLGFWDRSRYFFFQVASQLYSRGWAGPIPDSLLLRKSGSAGNWTRTSGSVTKNSDHYTTEAVYKHIHTNYFREPVRQWTVSNDQSAVSYNYHTSGQYASSWDWILSPSSGGTYSDGPGESDSFYWAHLSRSHLKTSCF